MRKTFALLLSCSALTACVSLDPDYERGAMPVPAAAGYEDIAPGEVADRPALAWETVFEDETLARLIVIALKNNRDLRAAALNAERVAALYRVQRAELVPNLAAGGSYGYDRFGPDAAAGRFGAGAVASEEGEIVEPDAVTIEQFGLTAGVSAYELDLFGRVRSLSRQALAQYFSTEAAQRSVRVSLIGEVANTYLQLAADRELLRIALETVDNQEEALELTEMRLEGGVGTAVDVGRVRTSIERARADAAELAAQVRQDENALRLLLGTRTLPDLDPAGVREVALRRDLPEAVPSELLLARPDVVSAEYDLLAANANIGAARAAFFPRIQLTGSGGVASTELDSLFSGDTGVWSFAPQISLPIFTGGALRGNLAAARYDREAAQARYEGTIQTAFREVADALAVRATIDERLAASERQAQAAADVFALAEDRFEAGITDYFAVLDAQREDYTARRALVAARLAEATNTVAVYRTLGGALDAPARTGDAPAPMAVSSLR
ncbi:efflux transporter outer membrane subunit [Parvularcula oceani]|uniref:efflux transporter outer membrane subunit n=1 Tax=Parvularcula oceani TaxID=1247963 RepID=UPI00068ED093|nr:efflux transporter outer membrane subunit [Parvularcula oceani]